MTETKRHVGVVGAGIVGVQVALALNRRGFEVTLVDRQDPGMATSFGNAGFIATDEIFPIAHGRVLRALPRMLLDPLGPLSLRWQEVPRLMSWYWQFVRACSGRRVAHTIAALAVLQQESAGAWQRLVDTESLASLVRDTGAYKLFESEQGFVATGAEREIQRRHGIDWEHIPADDIAERIPGISKAVRHAVFFPGGMSVINPLAVTQTLFEKFRAGGGRFLQAEVSTIAPSADNPGITLTDGDSPTFDAIVIAAGHRSGRLLKPLGLNVPLAAERGYHIEVDHREPGFDFPVGFHERGFYMTPMSTGLRLAGTSEISSADHDEPPNWSRAEILARHLSDVLPEVDARETGRWMGHRPTLCDFLPVLGPIAGSRKLYGAFGHHHLGLTMSAATGEILSAMIAGETPSIDVTPFSLERFQ